MVWALPGLDLRQARDGPAVALDAPAPLSVRAVDQEAIDELSPRFKQVIILRDVQELSYEEVGEILKIPLGTVKSRVNRARLKLQTKLEKVMSKKNVTKKKEV